MPDKIDTKHPEYSKNLPFWNKCNLVVEGEDAVKAAGTTFLPMLSEQETDDYNAYKRRASFYAASGRTLTGLVGVAFRKEPAVIDWPESKKEFLEAITKDRQSLNSFSKKVLNRVICTGRYGVMLDIAKKATIVDYPFLAGYVAESIINWRTRINEETGKEEVTMVVLMELDVQQDPDNRYGYVFKTRYRELFLDEEGYYTVAIWKEDAKNKGKYYREEPQIPLIGGKKLTYVPFVFFNPEDPSSEIKRPPLLDIVNLNISHYLNSADLEHGRHFTALPTPWAAGFKTTGKLYIGSPYAWIAEDPSAKAGFLEYTGAGLSALEKALEQKESQMAILGARMLEEPKTAVEATDTHRIRQAGEQSVLASMVGSVESGFDILLGWATEWMSISEDVGLEFNKDFDVRELSPAMLTALMSAVQQRGISYDTFFYNLKKGELYPDDIDKEEELDLIEQSPMGLMGFDMSTGEAEE